MTADTNVAYPQKIRDRFMAKFHVNDTGCWMWTGKPDKKDGYGHFYVPHRKQNHPAHRVSYEMHVGEIPDGHCVCHSCDALRPAGDSSYRTCVNPAHLFLGTNEDNMRDMAEKKRSASGERHFSRTKPHRVCRGDRHGSRTKPESVPRGERHGMAFLNAIQVAEIRARYSAGGVLQRVLGAEYGVDQTTISKIVLGKHW
jgi:hypothetical protein